MTLTIPTLVVLYLTDTNANASPGKVKTPNPYDSNYIQEDSDAPLLRFAEFKRTHFLF